MDLYTKIDSGVNPEDLLEKTNDNSDDIEDDEDSQSVI
jgi:hypothetical protein